MRFESKFDHDGETDRSGPIDLPDDLTLMAEQLRDDAQRLAACYPPQLGPVADVATAVACVSEVRRRSANRNALWFSAAVGGLTALCVLLMLTLGLRWGWKRPGGDAISRPIGAAAAPAFDQDAGARLANATPQSGTTAEGLPAELTTPASFSGTAPPVTPAVLRSGITGPAMEGWMDLRQDELAMDAESIEF